MGEKMGGRKLCVELATCTLVSHWLVHGACKTGKSVGLPHVTFGGTKAYHKATMQDRVLEC